MEIEADGGKEEDGNGDRNRKITGREDKQTGRYTDTDEETETDAGTEIAPTTYTVERSKAAMQLEDSGGGNC